jgi:hypothetical protein
MVELAFAASIVIGAVLGATAFYAGIKLLLMRLRSQKPTAARRAA